MTLGCLCRSWIVGATRNRALRLQQGADGLLLGRADLQDQVPLGPQRRGGLLDEPGDHAQTIAPSVERSVRFVLAHAGLQRRDHRGRDIRRVGNNDVERWLAGGRLQQVPQAEVDAIRHAVPHRVLAGQRQRGRGTIRRHETGRRMLVCAGDGQAPRACSHVGGPRLFHRPGQLEELDDHELGLGTRDEDGGRDFQGQRIEFLAPHEVRHGCSPGAAAHQLAVGPACLLARFLVVMRIELYPLPLEHVRQQNLGVQPRALRPALAQVVGGPGEKPSDRPGFRCNLLVAGHGILPMSHTGHVSPSCSRRSWSTSALVNDSRSPWITWSRL